MKNSKRSIFSALLLFLFTPLLLSCGKNSDPSQWYTKVSFSSPSYTNTESSNEIKALYPFAPGGLAIWGEGGKSNQAFSILFTQESGSNYLLLNNGDWVFPVVAWNASSLLGLTRCGIQAASLKGYDEYVSIYISTQECASSNFAPSNYLIGGQFKPLRIITCKNISAASANGNCDGSNKGSSGSYKVQILAYPVTGSNNISMPFTPAIESLCIPASAGSISGTSTLVNIPIGKIGASRFGTRIRAYESTNCSDMAPWIADFNFPKGLINGGAGASVFAGTQYTDVFLTHSSVPAPGIAYKLNLVGTSLGSYVNCLGPYTVSVMDSISVFINVLQDTPVTLTYTGTQDGAFYSDANCTSSTFTQKNILSASSSTQFYFKKSSSDPNVTLTATASGLISASSSVNITGVASKLNISGSNAGTINTCTGYTITLADSGNNAVAAVNPVGIDLTSDGVGANFYWNTDSTCTQSPIPGPPYYVSLPINQSSYTFYYKQTGTGSNSISFTNNQSLSNSSITVIFSN